MRVLGIETSGEVAGIAVVDADGLLAATSFRHRLELSRNMAVRVRDTLEMGGISLSDVEGIAVSVGPGSFTGLRIGVTAAKTLAFALGVPVTGIGSLAALAAEQPVPPGTLLCAVVSASKSQAFAALYQGTPIGLELRAEETLLDMRDLVKRLSATPLNVMVVGEPGPHREALTEALGPRVAMLPFEGAPRPSTVARLGRERLLAGQSTPAHALAPRYLRPSAAEARREEAACPRP